MRYIAGFFVSMCVTFGLSVAQSFAHEGHGLTLPKDAVYAPVTVTKIAPVYTGNEYTGCMLTLIGEEKKEFTIEIKNPKICGKYEVGDTVKRFIKTLRVPREKVG